MEYYLLKKTKYGKAPSLEPLPNHIRSEDLAHVKLNY